MKRMPLAAARRLFDGLVIAMLVCAVLFTLSNNFFLGCAGSCWDLPPQPSTSRCCAAPTAASILAGNGATPAPIAAAP